MESNLNATKKNSTLMSCVNDLEQRIRELSYIDDKALDIIDKFKRSNSSSGEMDGNKAKDSIDHVYSIIELLEKINNRFIYLNEEITNKLNVIESFIE